MSIIELQTVIAAPVERCFDLSLSVDVHLDSAVATGENVASGPAHGLLELGDTITWEARHFGRHRRLTVRITQFDRPHSFRDEMVEGPLRRMRHDHSFQPHEAGTLMRDEFEFAFFRPLDSVVLAPHLRRLLLVRNETIKQAAEETVGRST